MHQLLRTKKYGFIGTGNMSQTIMKALIDAEVLTPQHFWGTNRSFKRLEKVANELGIQTLNNNEELVDSVDVVILGTKPQDLVQAIEPIASSFHENQTVISLAAGISLSTLRDLLPNVHQIVRVMANTPAKISEGVIGYCGLKDSAELDAFVEDFLSPLGYVVKAEEGEEFEALTVASASGVGFVFEIMDYWVEWLEEHGFSPETARQMTLKTFQGAARLAAQSDNLSIRELQKKVVSKNGVTAAGLDSMREMELERLLRYSFEKAVLRDRELGKN